MIKWTIKAWTKCITGYRSDLNGLASRRRVRSESLHAYMSAVEEPQEAEVSSPVKRVTRIQRGGANRSSESMHDGHGL